MWATPGRTCYAWHRSDHGRPSRSRNRLGSEARPLLEAALETRRKQFGSRSLEVAQTCYELAELAEADDNTDPKARERWSRESLDIRRERLGKDDLDLAASLRQAGVAIAVTTDDKDEQAERLLQESLAIRRRRLGNEHLLVADSLYGIGAAVSWAKNDVVRGEPFFREALAMRRRLLGNDHPDTLLSIQGLANHLNRKGDLASAEPLYREEIATSRKIYRSTHPELAYQLNDLQTLLWTRGEFDEADRVGREALALALPRFPDFAAIIMANLADSRQGVGDADGAQALLLRSLELPHLPGLPRYREVVLTDLVALLNARGRHQDALRRANEAITNLRKGGSRSSLARALYQRADALRASDAVEADRSYIEGLEVQRVVVTQIKTKLPGDSRIGGAEALLGAYLFALHRYEEAEPVLIRSYNYLKWYHGERHYITREVRNRIVNLYYALGKPDKAAQYR